MSDNVFFIVGLEVNPDQSHELRSVMEEMVRVTRDDEPGTLNYEWFLNADGTECHIYERYADAAAAVAHSRTFAPELAQRSQAFPPIRLTAYGKLDQEVREKRLVPLLAAVPGIELVVLEPLGGFAR